MSRAGVLNTLAMLTAAYMKELTDPTIKLYVNGLSDLEDDALHGAAQDLIVVSKFFPTIASLRETAVHRMIPGGKPPSQESAWAEIMRTVETVGPIDNVTPDCSACNNTRFVVVTVKDEERVKHCECLQRVSQRPRPTFSHQMIGQTLDLVSSYNKLCRLNERELTPIRILFFKTYAELNQKIIIESLARPAADLKQLNS